MIEGVNKIQVSLIFCSNNYLPCLLSEVKCFDTILSPFYRYFVEIIQLNSCSFEDDFSYNIPLLEVDGYPINIAYNAGVTMDQEASWVGLGWNLNPGVVSRSMRGIPDDFNGSETVKKEFNMKPNWTAGTSVGVGLELAGFDIGSLGLSASLGVNYNNYNGFGANVSIGPSFTVAKAGGSSSLTASLGFSGSSQGGASVSPGLSFSQKQKGTGGKGSVTK